ncbi:MAG TPA: choice-of-anchor D domain-containing protein [Casimicrobiaceae bacterium]|nr:choice-of-anchor D domain-containing protein [Casimicrobiaceae bacterium]
MALASACLAGGALAQAPVDFALTPKAGETKFRFSYDPLAAWPSTLFWSYNPTGAPPQFADASVVASAMQSAIGKWQSACNISAAYAGTTAVDPEHSVLDAENGPQPDQINVVGWRATPAGIAGYTVGYSAPSAEGIWPIIDSDVVVDPAKLPAFDQLERLLVHEFGHVLGVNHSQFDNTLMSGPPYSTYNTLNTLTTDDIRGCRCLYGPPPGVSEGLLCSIPPVVDFGNVTAGTATARPIQLANNGNASISIASVTAGAAYQMSGCGAGTTISPGASCTMQVTFAPTGAGDFGSQITIAVNQPDPYRIKLIGTASGGTASPFTSDLAQIDFGAWAIGTPSSTQRVRFKNATGAPVTIGALLFEGPQANEFVRSGQCKANLTLAPNDTCSADVGFNASASGLRSATLVIEANDGRRSSLPVKGTGQSSAGTSEPLNAQPVTVVEFYRAVSDHYFITIAPDEIAALDTGLFPGWARTGLSFKAFAVSQSGYSPICRFYLPPPADSHFYSASPAECAAVAQQNPSFILESTAVMHLAVPNPLSGVCPAGTQPIYRVWNRRPDTNHRYTTSLAVRNQMVAKGYAAEGSGPDAVTFCAPL